MDRLRTESVHVRLRNITKRFGRVTAVDDLSLDVPEGKFTTLLGPSGCGKTTTLRMIAGIYSPDGGDILIAGQRVNDLPPQKRNTAMVFQEYALFPHMNVYENICYGLKRRREPREEIRDKVERMLEFLGLEQLARNAISQLSGGQQQRVALARALVLEPGVLLLDEPLSNLDAKIRIKIRTELKQIQQSLGKTTIYVTHDQEEALSISDYIALIDKGKLTQWGTPDELYYRPANAFAADFIGTANFVQAKVIEAGRDGVLVDLDFGRVLVRSGGGTFAKGDAVTLVIRPGSLRLYPGRRRGRDDFQGAVAHASFLGETTRFWLRTGSFEWIADVPSVSSSYEAGQSLWIRLDPEGVHALKM
jgi:ABC-type Fe3+/spermidine/putrescine transport system ATPase subunit